MLPDISLNLFAGAGLAGLLLRLSPYLVVAAVILAALAVLAGNLFRRNRASGPGCHARNRETGPQSGLDAQDCAASRCQGCSLSGCPSYQMLHTGKPDPAGSHKHGGGDLNA